MKRKCLETIKRYQNELFLVLFFAVVALIFTLPIFLAFDYWGLFDWDQHLFYHAVPRATILNYGQFPLWNPYYCGGTVLLANPQSRLLPTWIVERSCSLQ